MGSRRYKQRPPKFLPIIIPRAQDAITHDGCAKRHFVRRVYPLLDTCDAGHLQKSARNVNRGKTQLCCRSAECVSLRRGLKPVEKTLATLETPFSLRDFIFVKRVILARVPRRNFVDLQSNTPVFQSPADFRVRTLDERSPPTASTLARNLRLSLRPIASFTSRPG